MLHGLFALLREELYMTIIGKQIRIERILNRNTGRTVIVPMDHGISLGPIAGLEDVKRAVQMVAEGGANAIVEHKGLVGAGHRRKGRDIGLIVIDYLQLMQGPAKAESREREISHISRSLKSLAKELKIPVIALAQLNRAVETRTVKRPQLSDLRESGSIEQDADVVLFLNRPEYYGLLKDENGNSLEGVAEVIIGKQRNGPTGEIKLAFIKEYARFENLAHARQIEAYSVAQIDEDII